MKPAAAVRLVSDKLELPSTVMTETQLQNTVTDMARSFGWMLYHPWRSVKSETGFPDLVLVRPPRVIIAELKTQKGKLRPGRWTKSKTNPRWLPGQDEWLAAFGGCPGVETHLWRPQDLDSGDIEKVLN